MEVNRPQVDPGRREVRIALHHLPVKLDGAILLARLFGLHRLQKHLLHTPRSVRRRPTQRRRLGTGRRPAHLLFRALEVEEQLPSDGVHHRPIVPESQPPRPGPHQARLLQRICHARHRLHGHNRVPDRRHRHVFLAQGAQDAQLAQVLEAVALLLGNNSRPLPPLQLAGADLQDAHDVLAAIAGHSSVLPWLVRHSIGFGTRL